jgi:glycosyltransferase involved in cell wall biosynthesis
MLLEAAGPALKSGRFQLDILGDGPMRPALEAQVRREGLGDAVTFHGMVPHAQVQTIATRANLLTFPSIREFGGGVVLEAMALGLVPLIVDYAGPGELVGEGLGYKVPIGTRAEIVARFRARLETILEAPGELPANRVPGQRPCAGALHLARQGGAGRPDLRLGAGGPSRPGARSVPGSPPILLSGPGTQ